MIDTTLTLHALNPSKPPKSFLNKAERNSGYKTAAQQIFEGKKMLLERPEGMSRDEYRLLRKIESSILKQLFRKGHSPNRKLQQLLPIKIPRIRIAPIKKIQTPRKTQ